MDMLQFMDRSSIFTMECTQGQVTVSVERIVENCKFHANMVIPCTEIKDVDSNMADMAFFVMEEFKDAEQEALSRRSCQ